MFDLLKRVLSIKCKLNVHLIINTVNYSAVCFFLGHSNSFLWSFLYSLKGQSLLRSLVLMVGEDVTCVLYFNFLFLYGGNNVFRFLNSTIYGNWHEYINS